MIKEIFELSSVVGKASIGLAQKEQVKELLEEHLFTEVLGTDEVPKELQNTLLKLYEELESPDIPFAHTAQKASIILYRNSLICENKPILAIICNLNELVTSKLFDINFARKIVFLPWEISKDQISPSIGLSIDDFYYEVKGFIHQVEDGYIEGKHDEKLYQKGLDLLNNLKSLLLSK